MNTISDPKFPKVSPLRRQADQLREEFVQEVNKLKLAWKNRQDFYALMRQMLGAVREEWRKEPRLDFTAKDFLTLVMFPFDLALFLVLIALFGGVLSMIGVLIP